MKITDINGKSKGNRKIASNSLVNGPEFSNFDRTVIDEMKSLQSDMAYYWLSFLEMVESLLMHYRVMRTQNWKEFPLSTRLLLPWMAIYDSLKHMSLYVDILGTDECFM